MDGIRDFPYGWADRLFFFLLGVGWVAALKYPYFLTEPAGPVFFFFAGADPRQVFSFLFFCSGKHPEVPRILPGRNILATLKTKNFWGRI